MEEPVLEVSRLSKLYRLEASTSLGGKSLWGAIEHTTQRLFYRDKSRPPDLWALKDVTFNVRQGERVGVIGRNGAGKSTLLKILSRIVYPTKGTAIVRGRLTSLLEVGTGFNDSLSGRENVFLNASLYGLGRAEIAEKFDAIVAFAEMARFIDTPVKHYSSGMKMRLAFAVAAHIDPDILLMDEVLAVGDLAFQRKCLERVEGMTSSGQTLLFVSHSMDAVARYCDRCIWLDGGEVKHDGLVPDVTAAYVESVLGMRSQMRATDLRALRDTQAAEPTESSAIQKLEEQTARATPVEQESPIPASRVVPVVEAIAKSEPKPPAEAPELVDDEEASLIEAAVIDSKGQHSVLVSTEESVGIHFSYRVFKPGIYVPAIGLFSHDGKHIFQAVPADTHLDNYRADVGDYVWTAWIPSHLLNVGIHSITISLADPLVAPMKRFLVAEKVVSFHAVDPPLGAASVRGVMPRSFPGAIRPLLKWEKADCRSANKPL